MDQPLPGSPDHFFKQVLEFLKANAQGDVRCLILTSTAAGQYWINGMVDSKVWELGMVRTAETIMQAGLALQVQIMLQQNDQEAEKQRLKATEISGKAN